MKPFNLEDAKAGKAIIRGDGKPAFFVAHIPNACERDRVAYLDENGRLCSVDENGSTGDNGYFGYSLFMKTEKVTMWVNVYGEPNSKYIPGAYFYETKEEADKQHINISLSLIHI